MISAAVSVDLLSRFSVGTWTDISLLFFVDVPLLFFCGADPNHLRILFLLFDDVSGLKTNLPTPPPQKKKKKDELSQVGIGSCGLC
jgi:hypothetical protein